MRINKYLAHQKICTRREADTLIEKGKVTINNRPAKLGDKVNQGDKVEVFFKPRKFRYFAFHKPRGVITHSPQEDEDEIADVFPVEGVFPVGRLDKDSFGLIILTDDGRITDALLNPKYSHDKEYEVETRDELPGYFQAKMEAGVDIGGYTTKPCIIHMTGKRKFSITLVEGKKHQIRRMCGAFGQSAIALKRVRIMNVSLGNLKAGEHRALSGEELSTFLTSMGIPVPKK